MPVITVFAHTRKNLIQNPFQRLLYELLVTIPHQSHFTNSSLYIRVESQKRFVLLISNELIKRKKKKNKLNDDRIKSLEGDRKLSSPRTSRRKCLYPRVNVDRLVNVAPKRPANILGCSVKC